MNSIDHQLFSGHSGASVIIRHALEFAKQNIYSNSEQRDCTLKHSLKHYFYFCYHYYFCYNFCYYYYYYYKKYYHYYYYYHTITTD